MVERAEGVCACVCSCLRLVAGVGKEYEGVECEVGNVKNGEEELQSSKEFAHVSGVS